MPRRLRREDYTVGWVCALAVELAAAQEMLDEEDETPQASAHETNIYTCGRLGEHNVVIACLPEGQIGTNSAAAVAVQMKSAFTSIRFGLMVGIGGGVPGGEADIRLGDVVVSKPHTVHSGVVQYDLGKATLSGFKRTGYLDNPPTILLTAVASVQANKYRGRSKVSEHMAKLDRLLIFRRDKAGADVLFNAAYDHEGGQTCDKCSEDKKETRQPRDSEGDIVVHYGTIASGNQVMRNGVERDRVSAELGGVLYFEMEAAGLMNNFPYLVIRGICDYADSHKNKRWQPYAAGTAAAYAKEVLSVILPIDVANSSTVEEATRETDGYVYIGNRADGNVYGGLHLPSGSGAVSGSTGLVTQQCLHDLRVTDPRDDRARIEQDKDKLLKSCYSWILDDASFQRWKTLSDSRLLWVKGDPGKGKTMMTMGIIAELSQRDRARTSSRTMSKMLAKLKFGSQPSLLAYFFCQSTRPELNNAVSVLRGLIYMLVKQKGQLMRHVQKRYEATGSKLFEGPNAIYALKEILSDILNDPTLPKTYLIIDALDECISGLSPLLHIITDDSLARQSKVKWLVTSRNVPDIERYLQTDLAGVKISLEISASHVSKAVAAFVDYKMQRLAAGQKYDYKTRAEVQQQLYNKAEGTFLWVSLVCKELERVPMYRTRAVLQAMPPGLDPLYDLMMTQIMAQKHVKTAEYCKSVLQSVTVAFRPLRLEELVVVAGLPNDQFDHVQKTADLVSHCGSFLTVRQNIVSFIHLSAKDYFTSGHGQQIFHGAVAAEQGRVTHRLLNQMHSTLQRDMCGMQKPRARTQDETERFKDSALGIAYACEYWVDHLCDSNLTYSASYDNALHDGGIVDVFLQEKFLYWLEALSLCKSVPKGVVSVAKLWSLIQVQRDASALTKLIKDAHRFIMYHKGAIEDGALQAYASALLFSPANSLIRRLFQHEVPEWITIKPAISNNWSACLQTLEGHSSPVSSVVFSHDSTRLASASLDSTVKIWDASSGACLQTLEGHSYHVSSVAFSHDSTRLASASGDSTVKIWDASSGACLQTLEGHSSGVKSVAFSNDSTRLVSASSDSTVKIWDASSGACLQTLEGHSSLVNLVAFETQQPIHQGISISSDGTWITHNAQKRLWLPSEYRPRCSAVSGRCIGIGTGSGKVWICRLK